MENLEKKAFKASNFITKSLLDFRKVTALSCVAGLIVIANLPLFSAYEAHVINITARIKNDIPGINPPGGEFCIDGETEVELSVDLEDTEIYYTIDGTDPVCGLTNKYYIPFEIPDGLVTVKAVACHDGRQSAVMSKEFNASVPTATVIYEKEFYNNQFIDIRGWWCDHTYLVEWTVENYRGDVNDLTVDIVYIVDKDRSGNISAGDDFNVDVQGMPTGITGEYLFKIDRTKGYCYDGYAWFKVVVNEPDGCSGFGIGKRFYEPEAPGGLYDDLMADDSANDSIYSDSSYMNDNGDSSDSSDDEDNSSDNNNDRENGNGTEIDVRNEEMDENDNVVYDNNDGDENNSGENNESNDNDNDNGANTNQNTLSESEESIDEGSANGNSNEGNSEEGVLNEDSVIVNREEDPEENENNYEDNYEDNENSDSNSVDNPINGENISNETVITEDSEDTEIIFNL